MKKCSKCGICGADIGMEIGATCRFTNKYESASNRASNKKETDKMLDLTKIYTTKATATRALNKAAKDGEFDAENHNVIKVDGGFQIILTAAANDISGPSEFTDEELELKFAELAVAHLNSTPDGDALSERWNGFEAGTPIEVIHAWFDSEYSEGLEALKRKMSTEKGDGDGGNSTKNAIAKPGGLNDNYKSALSALAGVKSLSEKRADERAGIWFPFKEIYNSTTPADLPQRSMGGIMRALINRGLIQFMPDGKEVIGKKSVAVCLTSEGLLALQ